MTNRQLLTWNAWEAAEEARPARGDWYLMQIACEVRRVLAKRPASIKLEDFKLRFEDPNRAEADDADVDAISLQSQMGWFAMMTRPIRVVQGESVVASADTPTDEAPPVPAPTPRPAPKARTAPRPEPTDYSGGGMWDDAVDAGGGR